MAARHLLKQLAGAAAASSVAGGRLAAGATAAGSWAAPAHLPALLGPAGTSTACLHSLAPGSLPALTHLPVQHVLPGRGLHSSPSCAIWNPFARPEPTQPAASPASPAAQPPAHSGSGAGAQAGSRAAAQRGDLRAVPTVRDARGRLVPRTKNRNRWRRALLKEEQIRETGALRKLQQAAAVQQRDAARVARWRQRAALWQPPAPSAAAAGVAAGVDGAM